MSRGALYGLLLVLVYPSLHAAEHLVRVCDSDLDYPPFGWIGSSAQGKPEPKGFTRQLLQIILDKHDWRYELILSPIARCLRDVKEGSHVQLILNASSNAERERQFWISDPFWYAHFHAFYSRQQFPSGLPVKTKKDLQQFKVCGISGQNFSMFEVPAEKMDMGANTYAAAFQKLKLGRCDVFPYNIEVISGYKVLGQDFLADPDINHVLIEDIQPWAFRMLISRQYSEGPELLNIINSELASMRNNGELQKLFDSIMAMPAPVKL